MEDTCNSGSDQFFFGVFANLMIISREDGVVEAGDYMVTSETSAFPAYSLKIEIM